MLETNLLICGEQVILSFAQLLNRPNSTRVKFVGSDSSDTPDLAEHLKCFQLLVSLQALKFAHLTLGQELSDLLLDALTHERDFIHLVGICDFTGVSLYI